MYTNAVELFPCVCVRRAASVLCVLECGRVVVELVGLESPWLVSGHTSILARYYDHKNGCLQHNSALQRLSQCTVQTINGAVRHFMPRMQQSCSDDDEPAAGHACSLRREQRARRGRNPHLVERRHVAVERNAHSSAPRVGTRGIYLVWVVYSSSFQTPSTHVRASSSVWPHTYGCCHIHMGHASGSHGLRLIPHLKLY